MSDIILNDPVCKSCKDYGYSAGNNIPAGGVPSAPWAVIQDTGPVTLLANVDTLVRFANISVLDETGWTFSGQPWCWNSGSATVGFDIVSRTGTGFIVNAMEDSTLEFTAIKKRI